MKKKNIIAMLAAVLIISMAAGGTLAWFSAQSNVIENTFTAGDIDDESFKLTEAVVVKNEEKSTWSATDERTEEGNSYKDIYPGALLPKDPTVSIGANSEDCYVLVMVDNGLGNEASLNIASTWKAVCANGTKTIYIYEQIVKKAAAVKTLEPVFTTVTIADDAKLNDLEDKSISVKAFAYQAIGGTSEEGAIEAAKDVFGSGTWTDI